MQIHQPCPACDSSDGATHFDEGNYHCFACGGDGWLEGVERKERKKLDFKPATDLEIKPLIARKISLDTCKKYRYGYHGDQQVAQYFDETGQLLGQKFRDADKNMTVRGKIGSTLFGSQLFRPNSKLRVTITEGEIDALSVYEACGDYPVVSVPTGAAAARNVLVKNLEWLSQFKEVVLAFDDDEPGREAALECAPLFKPGTVFIAAMPDGCKDPNDCLQAGKRGELQKALWRAAPYRPPGIVAASDLRAEVMAGKLPSFAYYPWKDVNEGLCGLRSSEIVMWVAGSGAGKSSVTREVTYSLLMQDKKVGVLAFEESAVETIQYLMGLHLERHYHMEMEQISDEQKELAFESVTKNLYTDRHDGSLDTDQLEYKIKHLVQAEGCEVVILDHVSIVVSAREQNDERKDLDNLMSMLRRVCQQTGVNVQCVAHIKRQQGTPANEGGRIYLTDMRGSAALEQMSNQVVALERNQQGDDARAQVTTVRILKNRHAGWLMGARAWLQYNVKTGRMAGVPMPVEDEFDDEE